MSTKKLHIIITGETIDSYFHAPTESSIPNAESIIPHFLADKVKIYPDICYEHFSLLDSDDINDDLREKMVASIQSAPSNRILITHGTNTMVKTARYLNGRVGDKTVVLTGSMIPLKEFAMSDGGFNLGFAIAEALSKPAGVYLSMHAKNFAPNNVSKNFDIARFEETNS